MSTSNTQRNAAACPRRWMTRYGLGFRPIETPLPLWRGIIWHAMMDHVWDPCDETNERLEEVIRKYRAPSGFKIQWYPDRDAFEKVMDLFERMLEDYRARWKDSEKFEVIATELEISHPTENPETGEPGPVYTGKIDKLVRDRWGQLWIVDHKTTGRPASQWMAKHGESIQALTYGWLVWRSIDERPAGVVFDVASIQERVDKWPKNRDGSWTRRIPAGITRRAYDSIRDELKLDTVRRDRLERKIYDVDRFFARHSTRFFPSEIESIGPELFSVASQIQEWRDKFEGLPDISPLEKIRQHGWRWPRVTSLCRQFGRSCEFLDLCSEPCEESMEGLKRRE